MRLLNTRVSWVMTYLPLCLSALLLMQSGPDAFLLGNLQISLHNFDGENKIDLTCCSRSFFSIVS